MSPELRQRLVRLGPFLGLALVARGDEVADGVVEVEEYGSNHSFSWGRPGAPPSRL